ncbi:Dps family protein [Geminicoccaceae bacterium 1502E]|nr:Dps family protein [Geminicoccaceae bacterium 1502E]
MATSKPEASHEPLRPEIGLDRDARKALAEGLAQVLADSYTLLGKTHGFHWNVTGPQFPGLHPLFEEQYRDLQDAVDEIAERIRALGHFAPGSLGQFLARTAVDDEKGVPAAQDMLKQLAKDNELLARQCRKVVETCDKTDDTVTEDLMNGRIAFHEKAAWMLRASLDEE